MPLPSTAPSPDFNLRPTTFSLEDLKQDSRAVALLVIKDTTNWLAQHKDACTAVKYTIASSAARLLSNKPPCGTALTLAAQDIIKLLLVKYVHRDRGFLPRGDAAQAGCAGDVCARGVCTVRVGVPGLVRALGGGSGAIQGGSVRVRRSGALTFEACGEGVAIGRQVDVRHF